MSYKTNVPKTTLTLLLFFIINLFVSAQAPQTVWQSTIDSIYSFSSPRCADLNNDGILDIVFGAGLEGEPSEKGIIAIDGSYPANEAAATDSIDLDNLNILWTAPSRDQIFGSALFLDINADGTDDVFIGGRSGEFRALNGTDGTVIWEFYTDELAQQIAPRDSGIYQFYTPQFVPDMDGDGLVDLLNANGGDPTALLPTDPRPAGSLMLISSATGQLLAQAEVPDGKETYMSPLIIDFFNDGNPDIVFGTGGESQAGSLWRVPLQDLINNDISNAIPIISSDTKGYIAPPSLADLNEDNIPDIIANSYDGHITAINGASNAVLWDVPVQMGETNASPAIGFFNDDDVPDVFASYAIGVAPTFLEFVQFMIDGQSGEVLWQDSLGLLQFASPLVLDMDGDNFDEVILSINNAAPDFSSFSHELKLIDFNANTVNTLFGPEGGANVNATPWIGNLDNDGYLDIMYTQNTDSTIVVNSTNPAGTVVHKQTLPIADDQFVAWGAYIGSNYDGLFANSRSNCSEIGLNYQITTETTLGENCNMMGSVMSSGCPNPADCLYEWSNGAMGANTALQGNDAITVTITHPNGCIRVAKLNASDEILSDPIVFDNIELTASVCPNNNNGTFAIHYSGGVPPYTTNWNGSVSGGVTQAPIYMLNNLGAGTYNFALTDALGCSRDTTIVIENLADSLHIDLISMPAELETSNDGSIELMASGGTIPYTIFVDGVFIETWNPINETSLTIDNIMAGLHSVSIEDANGCSIESVVEVGFLGTAINDLDEINESELSIYPNPIKDRIYVKINNAIATNDVKIRIYNEEGNLVLAESLTFENQLIINVEDLARGIYFLQIDSANHRRSKKILKF